MTLETFTLFVAILLFGLFTLFVAIKSTGSFWNTVCSVCILGSFVACVTLIVKALLG